jgi:hypothetical protein
MNRPRRLAIPADDRHRVMLAALFSGNSTSDFEILIVRQSLMRPALHKRLHIVHHARRPVSGARV